MWHVAAVNVVIAFGMDYYFCSLQHMRFGGI